MATVRAKVTKTMALMSAVIILRPGGLENTNFLLIQQEKRVRSSQRERARRETTLPSILGLRKGAGRWWTEGAPAWGYIPVTGAGEEDTLPWCPNIPRII